MSPEQVARVEKHAARCTECRQLLAELGRGASEFDEARSPTLPGGQGVHSVLDTGQKVGRFVVINRLGSGGMGVVFAAYDPKLDRKVALKLLRSREETTLSPQNAQMRLLREAQAIAQLSHHENVVTVYDYGTFESEVYIAMEFVEGDTLTEWLRRWDRHWRDVIGKFLQAGKALAAAHAGGLVHRDFKPDNVLVGNDERVRVMDFGLARSLFADSSLESTIELPAESPPGGPRASGNPGTAETVPNGPQPPSQVRASPAGKAGAHAGKSGTQTGHTPRALDHPLTKTGTVLGTPRYMAPEQFSAVVADARSDQFSFCVALYEALYKAHPFEQRTAEGLITAPDTTAIQPPPTNSNVPSWLHKALVRGLECEPARRFTSMDALLREIKPRPRPQSRLRLIVPAAVAILAVALAAYLFITKRDTQGDLDNAHSLIVKLEKRSEDLNSQIVKLTAELRLVRSRLSDPEGAPASLDRLQRELAETRQDLSTALAELDATEKELAKVSSKNRPGRDRPGRGGSAGIKRSEVRAAIERYQNDFHHCFREWRQRARDAKPLYAVQLTIGRNGRPKTNVITRGIEDQVVHECVTGLLQLGKYRETSVVTIVQIGFRHDDGGVDAKINILDASDPDDVDDAGDRPAEPPGKPRRRSEGGKGDRDDRFSKVKE